MVEREVVLNFDDLLARRPITLACVSNEVGGPYTSTSESTGAPMRDLVLEAGIRRGAEQLLTSSDGFHTGIERVEVRVDGGPWRATFHLDPGEHVVRCQATDQSGPPRSEQRCSVLPDGATRWHSIPFTCTG